MSDLVKQFKKLKKHIEDEEGMILFADLMKQLRRSERIADKYGRFYDFAMDELCPDADRISREVGLTK